MEIDENKLRITKYELRIDKYNHNMELILEINDLKKSIEKLQTQLEMIANLPIKIGRAHV